MKIKASFSPVSRFTVLVKPKQSRAQRKAKAAEYRNEHPVLSGVVRVETYQPKAAWYNGRKVS